MDVVINESMSPYARLGGEEGVRKLVNRFYDLMDSLPQAQGIRRLHAADLSSAREKLFKFLSGWLGGPALYMQEYGHPRLRMRHMPFPIGDAERDAWMLCMSQSIKEMQLNDALLETHLLESLWKTADFMRNRED